MGPETVILAAVSGIILGYVLHLAYVKWINQSARQKRDEILQDAGQEADRIKKEAELSAKTELIKRREEFENESGAARRELRQVERRLHKREENLDRKIEVLTKKERFLESLEKKLTSRQNALTQKTEEIDALLESQKEALHRISGMTKEEATRNLLERLEREVEKDASELIERTVAKARERASEESVKLLTQAIQRCAAEHTSQVVVTSIDIPNDDMKGRIIGREGRNIRAFEKVTGIDVIVDDTPGVVLISGFNSLRREVARQAMERLIADGRIHPVRIEEVVHSVHKEVENSLKEEGRKACYEVGVHNMHPRAIPMLGRLKFRSNVGHNVLDHSMEVARLAGLMADEMNLDPQIAKRAGILHDIGMALDYEMEGHHALIGADFARRCDEKKEVVNAIAAHHGTVAPESLYAVLIQAANEISNARPGARKEGIDQYIKRMERLEEIANGYLGVNSAYAIQAGREIRVIVDTSKIDDRISITVARDIAKEIEMQMNYPGEIKVTLVRETRVVEYAR